MQGRRASGRCAVALFCVLNVTYTVLARVRESYYVPLLMDGNDNKTQEEEDEENEHGRNMKKLKRGSCLKVFWTMWCCELNLINHLPTLEAVLMCSSAFIIISFRSFWAQGLSILTGLSKIKWLIPRILSLHHAFCKVTSTINQQIHLYNFNLKHFKILKTTPTCFDLIRSSSSGSFVVPC